MVGVFMIVHYRELTQINVWGLGYDFQILDEFDIEPHDFKLGKLITPEGYFKNAL